jgi:SAM-dependent MidA family methyltransferase
MGSSTTPPRPAAAPVAPLDPAFRAAFAREAGPELSLRFDRFMALALYDPLVGYYRRDRPRVGRSAGSDFYTATSLGPIFGELVAAACASLITAAGLDPAAHTFVELGAEPSGGVLSGGIAHPFAGTKTVRVGEPLALAGPCVVFSNELFDAQPVRRFVCRADAWHELGVALSADSLHEHDFGPILAGDGAFAFLPPAGTTAEGYRFDAPRAAAALAGEIARQPWHGLFVAFDYGKSYPALAHETPQGTARAYHLQTQHNHLLAHPGEQDLTAHVCWDWLIAALTDADCRDVGVVSQESFFVHHAGPWIAATLAREASSSSPRKRALMHLLHPAQMGQKFQVLHALKPI